MTMKFKKYSSIILLTVFYALSVHAANDTIFVSGKITEAVSKMPVQGARVEVKNYSAAITDENGSYKIRIPYSTVILQVSAQGYAAKTVAVQAVYVQNIQLVSDVFINPAQTEGAFQKTDAVSLDDELKNRLSADVRVVKRSGQQGIGSNLFIRGYNTLNVSAKPLIVVDGVIRDDVSDLNSIMQGFTFNPLFDIDVNDIVSVEVIKNATSLYGSKGANGVILINTLRGKSETTKITFDASMGTVTKPQQIPVMNAGQYRTYITDVLKNAGYTQKQLDNLAFLKDDPTRLDYNKYHNDTNWGNTVYSNGLTNRYGVNVQGGDEIALYGFSVAYTDLKGVLEGTSMSRLSTRFNSDIKLTNKFKIGTGISFSQMDGELRDDGMNARTAPGYIALVKSPLFNPYKFTTSTGVLTDKLETVDDLGVSNPLSIIENGIGMQKQYRFAMNVNPQWEIRKGLKISSLTSYSINKMKEHYFIPVNGVSSVVIENRGTSLNVVKDQVLQQISLFSDNKITYEKNFGTSHELNTAVGYRFLSNRVISDYGEGHNTGGDYVTNLLASLAFKKVAGLNDIWTSKALYAQADYTYKQRYSVWATASFDNSSRFGDEAGKISVFGKPVAVFPAVGANWQVTGEEFMKNLKFINHMDLHFSYGLSGNDNIGNNDRFAYLQSVNYIDKAVGLQLANLNNPELQWETTRKLDGGVNISLFDETIQIGAGIYRYETFNLLTLKQNSIASGLGSYWTNEGAMQNTGYELTLGAKVIDTRWFKWNFNATLSHYSNKITALPVQSYTTKMYNAEILTSVGQPAGLFYGYNALGVISSAAEATNLNLSKQNDNGSSSQFLAGDMQFEDLDNNGIINEKDKKVIGNPNPDFTGTVFNSFNVKDFTLDVVLTYSLGNDIYNYQRSQLESMSNMYNQSTAVLNRWIANGQSASLPAAVYGDPMGNARFSSRWIEDGSYLKVQNIKLSYKLPLKVKFLNGVSVWASANNVFTFTKYLGADPETSINESVLYQGIDAGLLPNSRAYNMGVKVNL